MHIFQDSFIGMPRYTRSSSPVVQKIIFSGRFGDGYVLEGTAEKKDVLAFFGRRNEEEIVIEAKNVQNKQKI